ncbi:MAG TPA: hypothetical protein VD788_07690 [Candidatus Polarisedimenticolaceae bacterium]|nr:hypothetical protein [Candidatus Polarisedimenticolaceae bacterium]
MSRIARTIRLAPVVVLLLGAACAHKTQKVTFHDPNMDFGLLRSVAVMPFGNETADRSAADRVRDVFMTTLQATGAFYVLPPGEVARGISRVSPEDETAPTPDNVVALANTLEVDAVITGVVLEYGEVRSGTASANVITVSLRMLEAQSGRVVWSASTTKGGVSASDRLFGGGGQPMNLVTQRAIDELLDSLFSG